MNCPSCRAHNPDTATFCSLCHADFRPPAPPIEPITEVGQQVGAAPSPSVAEAVPTSASTAQPDAAPSSASTASTATKGRFRKTEEGFDWQCGRCAEWTPLEVTTCRVCGLPFREALGDEPEPKPEAELVTTMALTAIVPGLGHIAAKRTGVGAMRLTLFCLFFFGGLLVLGQSTGSAASRLGSLPLLAGALIVWAATMIDARALVDGRDSSILAPRFYLWLLIGVLVLTVMAAVPAALNARGDVEPSLDITEVPVVPGTGSPGTGSTETGAPTEPVGGGTPTGTPSEVVVPAG